MCAITVTGDFYKLMAFSNTQPLQSEVLSKPNFFSGPNNFGCNQKL